MAVQKPLKRTEFGDPILRASARRLNKTEITSHKTKKLIADMRHTLSQLKLGVGLAAPQVGHGVALAVIAVRPTEHRPKVERFDRVLINPVIVNTFGRKTQMWEGCISAGAHRAGLFAKVPRYRKVEVKYLDESGHDKTEIFEGLVAQVAQHEIDHLQGILFVDKVKDTTSYMTYKEYLKMVKKSVKDNKSLIY
jgi:peptide deformylase